MSVALEKFNRDAGTDRDFYAATTPAEIQREWRSLPPELYKHLSEFEPGTVWECRIERSFLTGVDFPAEAFRICKDDKEVFVAIDIALIRIRFIHGGWDHASKFILAEIRAHIEGLLEQLGQPIPADS